MAKKDDNEILLLLGLGAVLLMSAKPGKNGGTLPDGGGDSLPRGMRNNNPGNIAISNSAWAGKVPVNENTDGTYEQFVSYPYGVRALIKNLQTYQSKHGLKTIREIITRWAPPSENPTEDYIKFVSEYTGYGPDIGYNFDLDNLYYLVAAIAEVENGMPAVSPEQYEAAVSLL